MLLKLAWRNIWRNKSRTLITMAAVFFAVILSTLMSSVKEGVYANMIESMVGSYTGWGQIQSKDYPGEKTINNSLTFDDALKSIIENEPGISGYAPRIEGFALAASDSSTKGSMIVGIDVVLEQSHTHMNERVVKGEYLKPNDEGILVGMGLAEYLKLDVGDTIIALGQGYHGSTAAGKYPIRGILKFGSPELSKQLMVLPMNQAKLFFGVENQVSNLVLLFEDDSKSIKVINNLKKKLPEEFIAMNWKELIPDIVEMIKNEEAEGYIFMFILYMVISFGIFGTVLMMLSERKHEFGVLIGVGMKRVKLALVVWIEVIMMSVLGAFAGMFGAFPICYYYYKNPIQLAGGDVGKMYEEYGMEAVLQFTVEPSIFIQQATIVSIIACIIAIYPFISILKMNAIKAMRS